MTPYTKFVVYTSLLLATSLASTDTWRGVVVEILNSRSGTAPFHLSLLILVSNPYKVDPMSFVRLEPLMSCNIVAQHQESHKIISVKPHSGLIF